MYQNVYIDAVFAANFLMDYILLRLTGFFIREGRNRCRCLMAAAGGALFSSISLCIPAEQIPRMWGIVEIFCAAGMLILAYRIWSWKRLAMAVLIFYVLAFLSGGIWTEVMGNIRTTGVIFVLCAFGTYLGISLLIRILDSAEHIRSGSYPVVLKYQGKEMSTEGFLDTGNHLLDPISGTPVSVASWKCMKILFSEDLTERLAGLQEKPEKIKSTEIAGLKPHYLSCRTVGRGERLLLAVTLEELCIQIQGNTVHIKEPVVALSPEPFALGKEYEVLLNSRLLH